MAIARPRRPRSWFPIVWTGLLTVALTGLVVLHFGWFPAIITGLGSLIPLGLFLNPFLGRGVQTMAQRTQERGQVAELSSPVPVLDRPGGAQLCSYLETATLCAQAAGSAIELEFGKRSITAYKGSYDVQLRADLIAQDTIIKRLSKAYPKHLIVAEEGSQSVWSESGHTWAIDPLDGTNNFGYGVAHCAVAITLFVGDSPVLSVVFDPILRRTFRASVDQPFDGVPAVRVPLRHASVSLVNDYSAAGRRLGRRVEGSLSQACKRVFTLWAPALDLALVANGSLDAMVCLDANILDVCAGMFLVRSSGGVLLGMDGHELEVTRAMHKEPVSFVAARESVLARQLLELVADAGSG